MLYIYILAVLLIMLLMGYFISIRKKKAASAETESNADITTEKTEEK